MFAHGLNLLNHKLPENHERVPSYCLTSEIFSFAFVASRVFSRVSQNAAAELLDSTLRNWPKSWYTFS